MSFSFTSMEVKDTQFLVGQGTALLSHFYTAFLYSDEFPCVF